MKIATRAELNAEAIGLGIKNPETLPDKAAVLEAIGAVEPQTMDLRVVAAVERDLRTIGERDPDLARSGLAASALAIAHDLDANNSATSKSMCARALNETLAELRDLAPEEVSDDGIDELAAEREKRRKRRLAS